MSKNLASRMKYVKPSVLLQQRRDKAAAKRFFKRVLRSNPVPRKIVTDQLRSFRPQRPKFQR